MTTKQARRILGASANDMTEAEIQFHIKAAEVVKEIFFSEFEKKYQRSSFPLSKKKGKKA